MSRELCITCATAIVAQKGAMCLTCAETRAASKKERERKSVYHYNRARANDRVAETTQHPAQKKIALARAVMHDRLSHRFRIGR